MPKNKIINDPVHGFIEVPEGIMLELIDTEAFQRLRRIKQLALSSLVYPGAVHSRYNHVIGAMHLTRMAMDVLRSKDILITDEEYEGTLLAILLHDIGHGPFSHALESVILPGLHHERMSQAIMHHLNRIFKGRLSTAIRIFEGNHPKTFLHQLVSSQLDMDRLDYLVRDSYFTGVVEGLVASDRIIKTLTVRDNRLVVEEKGIYSVEKFLTARRLMYWQVYLHHAVVSAEYMMVNILNRTKELMYLHQPVWKNDLLDYFFRQNTLLTSGEIGEETIEKYIALDDEDILYGIKQWSRSEDRVLNFLCRRLLSRKLLKVRMQDNPFSSEELQSLREQVRRKVMVDEEEVKHLVFTGEVSNLAYLPTQQETILILGKDGNIRDMAQATDIHSIRAMSVPVKKHFICYPVF